MKEDTSLVSLYEMTGEEQYFVDAVEEVRLRLEENPNDPKLLHGYGYLHEMKARNCMKLAMECYQKAIEFSPEWPKAHLQLIGAKSSLGLTRQAIDFYKEWVAKYPDKGMGYAYLASAYLRVDQTDEAKKVIETGLSIDSKNLFLLDIAGQTYARNEESDKAIEYWRQALEIDANFVDARFGLVFLLERMGQLEAAIEEWMKIIRFLNDNGFAAESEWPKRELKRLQELLGDGSHS